MVWPAFPCPSDPERAYLHLCRLGLPPGLLLPDVCHLVALGVLSTLEGSVGCPCMGSLNFLTLHRSAAKLGTKGASHGPTCSWHGKREPGMLGGQHAADGQWQCGMPVSSCRDDTTINQTAPMHTTCSLHTAGPVCGGACTGKNCSGLLRKASWVCEHALLRALALSMAASVPLPPGPSSDGFAPRLEIQMTDESK